VRNQATTEEISVGRLREIEGGPRPSRTENRRPNGGRRPALGTRLSTAVTGGVAARPRDRNASHIASARDPATPEFGAKGKTLDTEPPSPKPVAPAFNAADLASAYPSRNGARTGSAKRSSRQRPARTASPRASASARIAAWPTFETASDRGTTGGRIFRMSAVRRAKSGIAMARAIRGLTGSRVSRSGSLDPRITKPPRRAPATLS